MKYLTYGEILKKSSEAKEMLEDVKKEKNLFKKTKITPDLFMPKSKPTSKFGKLKAYLNPYPKLSKEFSKLFKENYHIIFDNVICMLEELIYILDGAFYDFKKQLGEKYKEILNSYRNYKKIVVFLQESAESCNDKPNINTALVNKIISENEKIYEGAKELLDISKTKNLLFYIFVEAKEGEYNNLNHFKFLKETFEDTAKLIEEQKKEIQNLKNYVKELAKQCGEELNKSKN